MSLGNYPKEVDSHWTTTSLAEFHSDSHLLIILYFCINQRDSLQNTSRRTAGFVCKVVFCFWELQQLYLWLTFCRFQEVLWRWLYTSIRPARFAAKCEPFWTTTGCRTTLWRWTLWWGRRSSGLHTGRCPSWWWTASWWDVLSSKTDMVYIFNQNNSWKSGIPSSASSMGFIFSATITYICNYILTHRR